MECLVDGTLTDNTVWTEILRVFNADDTCIPAMLKPYAARRKIVAFVSIHCTKPLIPTSEEIRRAVRYMRKADPTRATLEFKADVTRMTTQVEELRTEVWSNMRTLVSSADWEYAQATLAAELLLAERELLVRRHMLYLKQEQ
jgi:hypothetical protein